MNKPLAILFDAGDTLIEYFKSNPLDGTKELLKRANNPEEVTAAEIQEYAMEIGKDFDKARESSEIEYSMRNFQRFLYEVHNVSFNLTPLEVENIFNRVSFVGTTMEGILDFLDYLEIHHIRKAILSNSSFSEEAIREELRYYGIDDKRFEFVISTSEYGFRKPNKKIFELALKKLNLRCDQVWYIGNSFKYDVIGAQNAGIQPVWFNRQENSGDRDNNNFIEVKKYKEIIDHLESK